MALPKFTVKEEKKKEVKEITTIKDIISPAFLKINPNSVQVGNKFLRTLAVLSYPRYLSPGWIGVLVNLDEQLDLSIFYEPIDTGAALKQLQKKLTQVEAQMLEREEKGQVRDPVLETAYKDIESLRDSLSQAQEKLLSVGVYITIYADSEAELNKKEAKIEKMLESTLVYAKPILYEQLEAIETTFPLGNDKIKVRSKMNTSPASTTFPFISADLTSNRGVLFGLNKSNNTMIIFDRFSLENAHMAVFARSGSGKSYATKLEIIRSLMIGIKVFVVDPENEYQNLATSLGGSFFRIALDSEYHINPFDIPEPEEGETFANVLKEVAANLTGLFRIILGSVDANELALLDRAITQTYASFDITSESEVTDFSRLRIPTLNDFEIVLRGIEGGEALAEKLYPFTQGNFSGFINQKTNVNLQNRFVIFGIRDLEDALRPVAMYIVLNYMWNLIKKTREKRIIIIDEAWTLMKYEDGASFLLNIIKRGRKYGLGVTTITQEVEDFSRSAYGRPIINNSALLLLLRQSPAVAGIVKETFQLSEGEKDLLLQSGVGEGIFIAGLKHVAIEVIRSSTEDKIITSRPEELIAIKKVKEEELKQKAK